jgi:hypothetical protein
MNFFAKRIYVVIAGLMVFASGLAYSAESPIFIRGTRVLGMGGAFTAISDDQNAMFFNPAGLTQRQGGQFTLFELQATISEDTMNFYQFYQDNEDKLKDFEKLNNTDKANLITEINRTITKYKTRVRVGFPNASYVSGPGFISWGAGVFDQVDLGFRIRQGLIVPTIDLWGNVDVVCAVPLAHRFDAVPYIPGKLSVGLTPKLIYRGNIAEYGKSILEFSDFNPVIQMGEGYGFDFGALYQPTDRWNAGLTVNDFGSTAISYASVETTKDGITTVKEASTGVIMPRWNLGTAYVPSKICYWPGRSFSTKDRLVLAADVVDLLNDKEPLTSESVWKKMHLGAEFRFYTLSLRTGFNSGYPSFGFGFGIPYVGLNVDYAYWADEMGLFAGQQPEWNHQLNLSLKWGGMNGRAYGSDVKTVAPVVTEPAQATPSQTEPTPASGTSEKTAQ